jgi:hypothetical protein
MCGDALAYSQLLQPILSASITHVGLDVLLKAAIKNSVPSLERKSASRCVLLPLVARKTGSLQGLGCIFSLFQEYLCKFWDAITKNYEWNINPVSQKKNFSRENIIEVKEKSEKKKIITLTVTEQNVKKNIENVGRGAPIQKSERSVRVRPLVRFEQASECGIGIAVHAASNPWSHFVLYRVIQQPYEFVPD